ncbi:MAG: hypothetical protein JW969_01910 [Spirochaetales bacterium]|nr:hypothetical protein [Spirochaetales bacterium]
MKKPLLLFAVLAAFALVSCGLGNSPQTLMIGKWEGDPGFYQSNLQLSQELESNPFSEMLLRMLENVKVEITQSEYKSSTEIIGQQLEETVPYRLILTREKEAVIESVGRDGRTVRRVIGIIDNNHIKIWQQDNPQEAYVLKRAK